ncbi:hypothetical protein AeNC1_016414 [Aphanomyces euteiches]|nr:hypothetical protein AeNC1_016414 [Aphanomyces euteiches]
MVLASSQGHGTSGSFDFYVFSQSWQPYFCTTGNHRGCENPTDFMSSNLTIHGLWPNYNSGGFPSFCGGSALTQSDIDQVGADSVAHGVDQAAYVQAAIDIETKLGTPSIISNNIGSTVSYRDLIDAYGSGNVALRCAGCDNALSEVRTCYDRAYNQIACPAWVLKQDNCGRKKSISIYTF